jgi:hypothetical protein
VLSFLPLSLSVALLPRLNGPPTVGVPELKDPGRLVAAAIDCSADDSGQCGQQKTIKP